MAVPACLDESRGATQGEKDAVCELHNYYYLLIIGELASTDWLFGNNRPKKKNLEGEKKKKK